MVRDAQVGDLVLHGQLQVLMVQHQLGRREPRERGVAREVGDPGGAHQGHRWGQGQGAAARSTGSETGAGAERQTGKREEDRRGSECIFLLIYEDNPNRRQKREREEDRRGSECIFLFYEENQYGGQDRERMIEARMALQKRKNGRMK